MSIQMLRQERDALVRQSRNLLDGLTTGTYTPEVNQKVEGFYAQIDLIDNQIDAHEKLLKLEAQGLEARGSRLADNLNISTDEGVNVLKQEKAIFNTWLRSGAHALNNEQQAFVAARRREASAIYGVNTVGTNSSGGFMVPRDFGSTLIEALALFGGVREVANVIKTASGRPIDWPTTDETNQKGELVGENVAAGLQDIVFGTTSITAYKYSSKTFAVSLELLQDEAIDIEPVILKLAANRIARIQNDHFTTGTGTAQPQGVVTAASTGKTGATGQTASVTYDDLVDLEHSLDPAYRGNAKFMMHDQTVKVLKKLKDTTGKPLWRPGVSGGDAADILGYGYVVNQSMPQMAANAKSILFADFNTYTIRDTMEVILNRYDDSAYNSKALVGFLAWARSDGKWLDAGTSGIKAYVNSAT
jgi:HK97 family phage major capsid protein